MTKQEHFRIADIYAHQIKYCPLIKSELIERMCFHLLQALKVK